MAGGCIGGVVLRSYDYSGTWDITAKLRSTINMSRSRGESCFIPKQFWMSLPHRKGLDIIYIYIYRERERHIDEYVSVCDQQFHVCDIASLKHF